MFLAVSSLLLLIVIAVQNYLYPPLREETISDGLYGPYHWFLDAAYLILATALCLAFIKTTTLSECFAIVASGALIVTAITNTFSTYVDKITNGLHSKLHTYFTGIMFVSMLALQASQNHSRMWALSAAGLVVPGAVYVLCQKIKSLNIDPGPAAEKTAVFFLCLWMIVYSVIH